MPITAMNTDDKSLDLSLSSDNEVGQAASLFRANNYSGGASSPSSATLEIRVTHVLCCPACPFMSLQEDALATHAAAQHAICALTVHRCRICGAASTQKGILEEHFLIYHGQLEQVQISSHLVTWNAGAGLHSAGSTSGAPVGSKKRKSSVPERIQLPYRPDDGVKKSKLDSDVADVAGGSVGVAAETPQTPILIAPDVPISSVVAPLDLSLAAAVPASAADSPRTPLRASRQASQVPAQQGFASDPSPQGPCGKPQRQNFTDAQNRQLQAWFAGHPERPYPSAADTRLLAAATGLSYAQVKKWFANRRMRTKPSLPRAAGTRALADATDGRESGIPSQPSSGESSVSQWS